MKIKKHKYALIIIVIMGVLAYINLGNRYITGDEGYNVVMGKYICNFGYPRIWDGNNIITTINGNDFNSSFTQITLNWLSYYIAAFGQLISKSSFYIRFWFVFIGLLSGVSLYYFTFNLTNNIITARICITLYALSVPIILYIRSANYFSPSLLFINLTYLFYVRYIKKLTVTTSLLLIISSVLLFHSNYMYFFITMGTLCLTYVLFDYNKFNFKRTFFNFFAIFIFTVPWLIWTRLYFSSIGSSYRGLNYVGNFKFYYLFINNLWNLFGYYLPICSLLIIRLFIYFVDVFINRKKLQPVYDYIDYNGDKITINKISGNSKKYFFRSIFLPAVSIIISTIFVSSTIFQFEPRYILACIPGCFVINAIIITEIFKKDKLISIIIIMIMVFTNLLNIVPYYLIKYTRLDKGKIEKFICPPTPISILWGKEFSTLEKYVENLHIDFLLFKYITKVPEDFDDGTEGIIRFLNKYAKPGDTIMTDGTEPITNVIPFYTNLKLVNVLIPQKKAWSNDLYYPNAVQYESLVSYPIDYVDWIPIFANSKEQLNSIINQYGNNFECIEIGYPNCSNISEIWQYNFITDNSKMNVRILRNKYTTDPINIDGIVRKKDLENE